MCISQLNKLVCNPSWKSVLFAVFFILLSFIAEAQNQADWKIQLEEKLESEGEVQHLHLVGYFDDHIFAEMFFAHDSTDWVGILEFPDSELFFELDGIKMEDHIFFNEFDSEGMPTGFWTIKKQLNQYVTKWQNSTGNMDFEFVMYDEFWNPDYKKDYHQLIRTYSGEFDQQKILFQIVRHHFTPSQMSWMNLGNYLNLLTQWECLDVFCNKYKLTLVDEDRDSLNVVFSGQEFNNKLVWKGPYPQNEEIVFELDTEHYTKVKTRLSLIQKLVVEYPVIENKKSERVIELVSERLMDTLQNQLEEATDIKAKVESRWGKFAHAWLEIMYWDNNFLSGKWIVQRNWTEDLWTIPFNLDIEEGLFFDLEDQFIREFDFEYFHEHFVKNGIRELPEFRDLLIRNKLLHAEFNYLNFCPVGIVLSTDFDTLFGSFQLMIPYPEIESYLRKRSILKKIFELNRND